MLIGFYGTSVSAVGSLVLASIYTIRAHPFKERVAQQQLPFRALPETHRFQGPNRSCFPDLFSSLALRDPK